MSNKLQAKDLINLGLFTVLYFVIGCCVAIPVGFVPIFLPILGALWSLITGIPFMLFLTRVKKFGMVTIMGILSGLLMGLTGMGFWGVPMGVIFGLLGDLILKSGGYKSAKKSLIGYAVFSLWMVGTYIPMYFMKNYPVKWEGAVKAGKQMANAIVEYIGGIEVVKAFSQSAGSYKKYSDAVNYNANYYVDWMRENQKTMSAYNAILPSVLICVLPCGFAFWLSGSLELSTFLSIVIFSLGLIGPIIAAFTFTDDLAVLGTNVEEISQLLNAEELNHKDTPVKLEDTGISLRSVSFSYDGTTEVLHDVNLTIHPGTMTALVGRPAPASLRWRS